MDKPAETSKFFEDYLKKLANLKSTTANISDLNAIELLESLIRDQSSVETK